MDLLQTVTVYCVLCTALLHVVNCQDQGFFMVSHYPQIDRSSTLHIYAIESLGRNGDFVIAKNGGLPTNAIESGSITVGDTTFGCFLRVYELNRMRGLRYGQYTGTFTSSFDESVYNGYTFVKQKSDTLDTRGLRTVTVYPESTSSNDLDESVQIGVRWTPGCNRIFWCKGKNRNVNSGPRFTIKNTDDAGLYTIRRPRRAKRGWFAQILVIAASCPEGEYYDDGCNDGHLCINGGVLRDNSNDCICPPFMSGRTCKCALDNEGDDLVLGYKEKGSRLLCEDLPGGDPKCKGHLVCYGDNYGCKCASGWWGNACDQACPKGKWGADCEQSCPDSETDCNRFYGPSDNLRENGCSDGYIG